MTLRRWILCILILTTGRATSGSGGATANALPPCQVEVDESRDWRQVTSDVVSFCVPAGWTSLDRNGWGRKRAQDQKRGQDQKGKARIDRKHRWVLRESLHEMCRRPIVRPPFPSVF
jgi:hypothetical protein